MDGLITYLRENGWWIGSWSGSGSLESVTFKNDGTFSSPGLTDDGEVWVSLKTGILRLHPEHYELGDDDQVAEATKKVLLFHRDGLVEELKGWGDFETWNLVRSTPILNEEDVLAISDGIVELAAAHNTLAGVWDSLSGLWKNVPITIDRQGGFSLTTSNGWDINDGEVWVRLSDNVFDLHRAQVPNSKPRNNHYIEYIPHNDMNSNIM